MYSIVFDLSRMSGKKFVVTNKPFCWRSDEVFLHSKCFDVCVLVGSCRVV